MAPNPYIPLISSIVVVLGAGFPLTFSLYATSFQSVLGLNQTQVNSINVANIIGQFIGYPIIGYCSDRYGAHVIALLGSVLAVPGLLVAASAYQQHSSYLVLAMAFFWIGVGSTCGYISGMSTCVRSLPRSKGLAISLPVCSYGLATLIYSIIFETFFSTPGGYDIPRFWRCMTIFVTFASIVGFFGMRIPRTTVTGSDATTDEARPLLDHSDRSNGQNPPFFKDISVLFYALGYVLIAGSTETLVGNMGSVLASLSPSSSHPFIQSSQASTAVSLFAVFSTLARLLTGSSLDLLAKHGYSRFHIPIFVVSAPMSLAFLALGLVPMTSTTVLVMLSLNGFCYGAMYCSGPAIAAEVWGVDNFGRNWGVLSYSPLIGSTAGSFLYALIYDAQAKRQGNDEQLCVGQSCFSQSLFILGLSIALGAGLWLCSWRVWRKRHLLV